MYHFSRGLVIGEKFVYNKTVLKITVQLDAPGRDKPCIPSTCSPGRRASRARGVLSAYEEQVRLVKEELADEFVCYINRPGLCDIMHYHTINPEFFALRQMSRGKSVSVGYVHFCPRRWTTP